MQMYKWGLLCSCAALTIASPLAAQSAAPPPSGSGKTGVQSTLPAETVEAGEIVVTAQKRSENVQKVPISISVVSGGALEKSGVVRFEQLGTTVPNFTVASYAISDAITIRGINSNSTSGSDQAVGLFVDGVYRSRGIQSRFAFLDLDRIEVLRGPQGTLFGKNTLAGAVNITTAKPTKEFHASLQELYEFNNNETDTRGFISGPLTDNIQGRLAFSYTDLDKGWVKNDATGEHMPQQRNWAVRGSIAWQPTDGLSLIARYEHGDIHQNGAPNVITVAGPLLGAAAALGLPAVPIGFNGHTSISNAIEPFPGSYPASLAGPAYRFNGVSNEASAQLDAEIGGGTLTVLGAYSQYDYARAQDIDFTSLPVAELFDGEKYKQGSAEIRFASDQSKPFYYLIGAFYQQERLSAYLNNTYNTFFLNNLLCAGGSPACGLLGAAFPNGADERRVFSQRARTAAVFAQVTYKPIENIFVTAGLRYGNNRKRAVQTGQGYDATTGVLVTSPFQVAILSSPLLELTPHAFNDKISHSRLLPQASVRWEVAPTVSLYASYARGDQDGGFNSYAANNVPSQFSYKPTSSDDFEIGTKLQMANRRVTVNINYFNEKFKDLQTISYTGSSTFIVNNAASARSQGVEFETRWRVLDELTVGASGAYTRFKYLSFRNAGCTVAQIARYADGPSCAAAGGNDLSGKTNIHAPKFTITGNAEYRQPIGDYMLTLTGEAAYSSSFYDSSDLDSNTRQNAFTKIDASIAIGPASGQWELAFVGRNLTNKLTSGFIEDTPVFTGSYHAYVDRPRTLAVRGSMKF
jgi:outer membrane receptor protein involved in Fe transport